MSATGGNPNATPKVAIDTMLSTYVEGDDEISARLEEMGLQQKAAEPKETSTATMTASTTAAIEIVAAGEALSEEVLQPTETPKGKDGGKTTGGEADGKPELAPSGVSMPDVVVNLMKSLSTPMNDGLMESMHVEDPDWQADHHLSWDQLTNVREIGKGLTCTVYTAKVAGRKSKVIAKVARPRDKGRLEDQAEKQLEAEFNVLRQVKHPHIVELLGAGFTPEGRRFILLEHLPEGTLGTFHALSSREQMKGQSAYKMLKRGFQRLTKDLSRTLTSILQVAEALEYLQTQAIPGAVVLHRDLRPDNVGIAPGGIVKIFDFGLSKALMKGHDGKLLCPMVGEAGSLRYAAPEVSMGLPHGGKADVYSWALLAWSVVAVHPPFEGIGRSEFYARVVMGDERPKIDPEWPKEFQELLQESWSGDALMRPPIGEVVKRMKGLLNKSGA